jgi:hypothetical protein
VRAQLTEAIQSAQTHRGGGSEPAPSVRPSTVARARSTCTDRHRARRARQREADVVRESIRLLGRSDDLEARMREVRRTTRDLYAEMEVAETSWPPSSRGGRVPSPIRPSRSTACCACAPVDEPRAYSDNWHAPRWGGGFHLHQGSTSRAPGHPDSGAVDGTAVAPDNWLGGIAVKVYGEAGYVYNAHCPARSARPRSGGDIIGYVGSTGNASGPRPLRVPPGERRRRQPVPCSSTPSAERRRAARP